MKFIKYILPHLAIAFGILIIVMAVLDAYNPFMAFLTSQTSKICIFIAGALLIINAVTLIVKSFKE